MIINKSSFTHITFWSYCCHLIL